MYISTPDPVSIMDASPFFILVAIVALAVIAILTLWIRKKEPQKQLSPLASLAFLLVVAGILFGEDRITGYGLLGAGVVLAIVDIIRKQWRRESGEIGAKEM
jgi:drug/metabolite transporter (DMT)-like permease